MSQCRHKHFNLQNVTEARDRMKNILKTTAMAFIYSFAVFGISLAVAFIFVSGNILKALTYGLLGGLSFGLIMTPYLFLMLILFQRKLFFYGNMPKQLHERGVRNVYYESIAGNASSARIKYGGLFLTDNSVLFIPHKFAIKPLFVELPLNKIKKIRKTGINLLKHFSGGLRKRLLIETTNGKHYEFSVWDIDIWVEKIDGMINR
jgi:hypothetical protein